MIFFIIITVLGLLGKILSKLYISGYSNLSLEFNWIDISFFISSVMYLFISLTLRLFFFVELWIEFCFISLLSLFFC